MVIVISDNKCTLTDSRSFEEYDLIAEFENNLKAHWDFRSEGMAKRYYIGSLLVKRDYNEIEWSEMRKKRKTDKWMRIGADKLNDMAPRQWLQHIRSKRGASRSKHISRTKLVPKSQRSGQSQYGHLPRHHHHHQYPASHGQQRDRYKAEGRRYADRGYAEQSADGHYYDHRRNDQHRKPSPPMAAQYAKPNGTATSRPKYVLKPSGSNQGDVKPHSHHSPTSDHSSFRDPAIMDMGGASQSRKQRKRYQTEHRPLKREQKYYVEYYPKPRKTKLLHSPIHRQRHTPRSNKQYDRQYDRRNRNGRLSNRQPAVLDAYLQSERGPGDRTRGASALNKDKKKRSRDKFSKHLSREDTDRVLEDTASFENPVLYKGEISLSRYNPSVAYVSVEGLDRDIRISGRADRNRAFHGDVVTVSIYPEKEWLQAIRQEVVDFKEALDQRDRDREDTARKEALCEEMEDLEIGMEEPLEMAAELEMEEEVDMELDDEDNDDENGYNASGSSSDSMARNEDDGDGDGDGDGMIVEEEPAGNALSAEDPSGSALSAEEPVANALSAEDFPSSALSAEEPPRADKGDANQEGDEKKEDGDEKKEDGDDKPGGKAQGEMFQKMDRKRMDRLLDENSVTAYDHYLFLKNAVSEWDRMEEKWPSLDADDAEHPRRAFMDSVVAKCGGKTPREALSHFDWPSPHSFPDRLPRGRVVGLYDQKRSARESVPGYLLPVTRGKNVDSKWALFTPSDKRYPKAHFPTRELPQSMRTLFKRFEREQRAIEREAEQKRRALKREKGGRRRKDAVVEKRANPVIAELRLQAFEMRFESKWPDHCFMPVVHFKAEIGRRGAVETETRHILSNHSITWDHRFSPQIEDFVKDFSISEEDFVGRRDVRHLRVFTIDPTSARDFDDALSIEALDEVDGGGKKLYRVGIHIADVTHFVAPGTILDAEARNRATSVYLVDRCLPMLPHHLCQNLCSLNPDVDRLAYSVFVVLNEEGHLVPRGEGHGGPHSKSPWFGRTVIRSRARLNYETAHWMLIDRVTAATPLSELHECCSVSDDTTLAAVIEDTKMLWSIARRMRERRFEGGSVQFFRPQLRFRLDPRDKNKALVFGPEILLWSNNLVEEMMLLANQLVAGQLVARVRPHALLRTHPDPLPEKAMNLRLICRSQNVQLNMATPNELNESLLEMKKVSFGGITMDKAINAVMATTMQRASYVVVEDRPQCEYKHWALNFPIYTHFTSPIRRYADVIVHRLLSYTVFMDSEAELKRRGLSLPSITTMKRQCELCNTRNQNAHYAEMDSQRVHLCLLLMERPIVVDCLVIIISAAVFNVVVPGLGLDLRAKIRDCVSESGGAIKSMVKKKELPDSLLAIKWEDGTAEEVGLFGKMRVRLSSKLKLPLEVTLEIIEPSKRKYLKPVNASAIEAVSEDNSNSEELEEKEGDGAQPTPPAAAPGVDVDDDIVRNAECPDEPSPVAMTLESQLKVGVDDFQTALYD